MLSSARPSCLSSDATSTTWPSCMGGLTNSKAGLHNGVRGLFISFLLTCAGGFFAVWLLEDATPAELLSLMVFVGFWIGVFQGLLFGRVILQSGLGGLLGGLLLLIPVLVTAPMAAVSKIPAVFLYPLVLSFGVWVGALLKGRARAK